MNKVINLGIPHVGELIFESINTPKLIKFLLVSETWRILAENVLIKRIKKFKHKTFEALLWRACDTGRKDVVQLLIHNYPNLNAKDDSGRTVFMIACKDGREDVVQLIIDYSGPNIDLNTRDNNGNTAFMLACIYGHKDVVQLLLEHFDHNIDLQAKDKRGKTVLGLDLSNRNKEIIQLLEKLY